MRSIKFDELPHKADLRRPGRTIQAVAPAPPPPVSVPVVPAPAPPESKTTSK